MYLGMVFGYEFIDALLFTLSLFHLWFWDDPIGIDRWFFAIKVQQRHRQTVGRMDDLHIAALYKASRRKKKDNVSNRRHITRQIAILTELCAIV